MFTHFPIHETEIEIGRIHMRKEEKQLFKALCKFHSPITNEKLTTFATPTVLGELFFNRMQGIAYDVLRKNGLLNKVNREFRNSLAAAYEENVQKNRSFYKCVNFLSTVLACCDFKVAMLKGAYLCAHYPEGYRTCNDVDLLVLPQNVTKMANLLKEAGFTQGNIRNGEFVPATRKEIIESKMMRGETIPFVKEVNLPFLKFFEVDINFSLDYKTGDDKILTRMLSEAYVREQNQVSVLTLSEIDFFIHLCAHLYKEATTMAWIQMNRDMTLYKYCDIYMLLSEMSDKMFEKVLRRAKNLGMERICAYAVLESMELFDMENDFIRQMAADVISNSDFRLKVTSPQHNKHFIYQTADTNKRFFMKSREKNLKEVEILEKT